MPVSSWSDTFMTKIRPSVTSEHVPLQNIRVSTANGCLYYPDDGIRWVLDRWFLFLRFWDLCFGPSTLMLS